LFLFDEPTTGLHFDDIAKLMRALRKLLEGGHSLIVIEHNLDVIRASDWLIDLGPEGGDAGGYVVAEGMPEDVRNHATSHTALALREYAQAMGELGGILQVAEAPKQAPQYAEPALALSGAADRYDHREDTDYYSHAGALFRLMSDEQKTLLTSNIAGAMGGVSSDVVQRQLQHFYKADPAYGEAIAKALGVSLN